MKRLIEEVVGLLFGALLGSAWAFVFYYALTTPDPFEVEKAKRAKEAQCEAYKEYVGSDPHIREVYLKVCLEDKDMRSER